LAHVRVLALTVPLERLREKTNDDNYLESIEKAELEFEDLAVSSLDIQLPSSDDEADS
jgi:hypothetical protein